MSETIIIIAVAIQFIMIIVFFVMSANVAKIKAKLYSESFSDKEAWVMKEIGKQDEAYEIILQQFLGEVYFYKDNDNVRMPKETLDKYKKLFNTIGKDMPAGYESAFSEG